MPTIKQALDTYQHHVSQIEGGLTALDLWGRRIGITGGEPLDAYKVTGFDKEQIKGMAGQVGEYTKQDLKEFGLHPCPLSLSATIDKKTETFAFEIDPAITVSAANTIATRYVAKRKEIRGTIKESWAQDDWKVEIRGLIVGTDEEDLGKKMAQLISIISADQTLDVVCPYLQDCYAISRLVVQSYQFPATKGLRYQQVSLTCLSDGEYDLLEDAKTTQQ